MIEYVSNNGSGRERLVNTRMVVVARLREAIDLMGDMCPHGRDYVGASEGLYEADRSAYWTQRENLLQIAEAIETEALAIHNLPGGY